MDFTVNGVAGAVGITFPGRGALGRPGSSSLLARTLWAAEFGDNSQDELNLI